MNTKKRATGKNKKAPEEKGLRQILVLIKCQVLKKKPCRVTHLLQYEEKKGKAEKIGVKEIIRRGRRDFGTADFNEPGRGEQTQCRLLLQTQSKVTNITGDRENRESRAGSTALPRESGRRLDQEASGGEERCRNATRTLKSDHPRIKGETEGRMSGTNRTAVSSEENSKPKF